VQTKEGLIRTIRSFKIRVVKIHLGTRRYADVFGECFPSLCELIGIPIVKDENLPEQGIEWYLDFDSKPFYTNGPTRPPLPQ
jgi:hypothetical protein